MASQQQYGQEEDPNEDRPQQTKIAKDNKVDYRAKKNYSYIKHRICP